MNPATLERIAYIAPVLLFAMVAHEYAHGYAALKQGDPTAYQLGRLTWNPIKHIDPVMTILMPAILLVASGGTMALGGAKPVPVQPRNYRKYKRGDIIVSLAGVATNLLIALASTAVYAAIGLVARAAPALLPTLGILQTMTFWSIVVNLGLFAFNLVPIPPLDGSHVMKYLLPPAWAIGYQRIGAFGFFILIVLLQTRFLDYWFVPTQLVAASLLRLVAPFAIVTP